MIAGEYMNIIINENQITYIQKFAGYEWKYIGVTLGKGKLKNMRSMNVRYSKISQCRSHTVHVDLATGEIFFLRFKKKYSRSLAKCVHQRNRK